MVVYTDGSVRRAVNGKGQAGVGVVIQSQETHFISQPIGIASILTAEASAVLIGILTVLSMSRKKERILVRTDCKTLADQIANPKWGKRNKDVAYKDLLDRLRKLITPDIEVEWVPRERNYQADALAKTASAGVV